jgi:hypothetical protein
MDYEDHTATVRWGGRVYRIFITSISTHRDMFGPNRDRISLEGVIQDVEIHDRKIKVNSTPQNIRKIFIREGL